MALGAAGVVPGRHHAGGVARSTSVEPGLLDVDPALLVELGVAVEAGGDPLLDCGAGEHVARELLDRKVAEGEIAVEGLDHPVAVSQAVRRWSFS